MMDPDIIACRCELAAEALNGISFQAAAVSRFLQSGDRRAAIECYARVVAIFKEFVAPEMRIIKSFEADAEVIREAATEWRANRKPWDAAKGQRP